MNFIRLENSKTRLGFLDDRAVSPVIGIVLMLAITITLIAVISSGVLSASQFGDQPPIVNIAFSYSDSDGDLTPDTVTLTHDGGDTLDPSAVEVRVDGTPQNVADEWATGGKIRGGNEASFGASAGARVTVVWSDGGTSNLLLSFTVE